MKKIGKLSAAMLITLGGSALISTAPANASPIQQCDTSPSYNGTWIVGSTIECTTFNDDGDMRSTTTHCDDEGSCTTYGDY